MHLDMRMHVHMHVLIAHSHVRTLITFASGPKITHSHVRTLMTFTSGPNIAHSHVCTLITFTSGPNIEEGEVRQNPLFGFSEEDFGATSESTNKAQFQRSSVVGFNLPSQRSPQYMDPAPAPSSAYSSSFGGAPGGNSGLGQEKYWNPSAARGGNLGGFGGYGGYGGGYDDEPRRPAPRRRQFDLSTISHDGPPPGQDSD
jgi:hypothetical protein